MQTLFNTVGAIIKEYKLRARTLLHKVKTKMVFLFQLRFQNCLQSQNE